MDQPPSLVINAKSVYSTPLDGPQGDSLWIEAGRVRAIAARDEIAAIAPRGVQCLSLESSFVLPGLVDAHVHLEHYAAYLEEVEVETESLAECVERVRSAARSAPAGNWILGHGWNHNVWSGYGTRRDLDAAAPNHPVYLTAKSLHAGWANSEALRRAGVTRDSTDPSDGVIERDSRGEPTGILLEGAMSLVARVVPIPDEGSLAARLQPALARLSEMGLTGVHDFDGPRCFAALQILHRQGRLTLRCLKSLPAHVLPSARAVGLQGGFGDDHLRLGHVKAFADGALGPRTAAMLDPYEDVPGHRGILLLDDEQVLDLGLRAGEAGFALAVHAIGDRANHLVLDAFETLRREEKARGWPARRHRIEHLQLMHPHDVARPGALNIVASMQPIHATSDMAMADLGWGPRVRHAYAWKSQHGTGAVLAFGSDAPVESPNPFWGIHAAVTRRKRDGAPGPDGWTPDQRILVEQAWSGFSEGPAYAAGWEDRLGRLRTGYWADLVVMAEDPLQADPDTLAHLRPLGTMVGGEWTHRSF